MNKYDAQFDQAIKDIVGRQYRNDPIYREARQLRDPTKSELAQDQDYVNFLTKICPIVGTQEYISVEWVSGGVTGGNCWGGEADCPVDSEPPEELNDFDRILEVVCPNIEFMQYKSIMRDVVYINSYTVGEYYGNSTSYTTRYCLMSELYKALKDRGILNA